MFQQISGFFEHNPGYAGLVIAVIGLLTLLGSLLDWNWMYADKHDKIYRQKMNGEWLHGSRSRKTARFYGGIKGATLLIGGVIWFFVWPR